MFFDATKIPIQLFSDKTLVKNYGSEPFQPDPVISMISCIFEVPDPVCYTITPEFLVCGIVRVKDSSEYLAVGPAPVYECTRKQAQDILIRMQQPVSRADEMLRWLRRIPICGDHRFQAILCFLNYIVNGEEQREAATVPFKCANKEGEAAVPAPDVFMPYFGRTSDILEKQILTAIEYGDTNAVIQSLNETNKQSDGLPDMSLDSVRTFRNILIVSTTLASRAALKGGLDYGTVTELSDYYLKQTEALDTYTDLSNLLRQMFLDFTQRTAKCRTFLSDSPLTARISKDIRAHLHEKITPTLIAARLKMNCSYLCRHFKKETGKTISEFINEMKVEEGKHLLSTTNIPIAQIAAQLGFSSQQYFHTVFKKIAGMTPVEFRNKSV